MLFGHKTLLGCCMLLLCAVACNEAPAGSRLGEDVAVPDMGVADSTQDEVLDGAEDAANDTRDVPDDASETDAADGSGDATEDPFVVCTTRDDCEGGPCVPLTDDGSIGVCSTSCTLVTDCPDGFSCVRVGSSGADEQRVCLPTTFCLDQDGDGFGIGPGCLGPDCDDADPDSNPRQRERCDGRDNDCSGTVDDAPQYGVSEGQTVTLGDPCNTGFPGICDTGRFVCELGLTTCAPSRTAEAEERCNGLDDTCDGYVDTTATGEALTRTRYTGPEGTDGVGLCVAGQEVCSDGAWVVLVDPILPSPERCDSMDWSCDGTPDDVTAETLSGDRNNCGSCGNVCAAHLDCRDGECVCAPGGTACDGVCVDTMISPQHCGACGDVCPADAVCTGGSCNCGPGRARCGDRCVDFVIDRRNCGGCGNLCATEQLCESGACQCLPGRLLCGERCIDPSNDSTNCGGCDIACGVGQLCTAGVCGCPAGAPVCDGLCTDLQNDRNNCGGCGTRCHADQFCGDGTCSCGGGNTLCAAGCRNLQTDDQNCGTCGSVCAGDTSCRNGVCGCPPGTSRCGNRCVPQAIGGSCYTAGAGSPGIGVCAPGTWTCAGESATCVGQVGPAARVCDGADNNCNGVVDDGCPSQIALGATSGGPIYGGSGGTAYTSLCGENDVVVGVELRYGSEIDRLQLRCQPLGLLILTGTIPHTFRIDRTGSASLLTAYGGTGGSIASYTCPSGEAVVGIQGRAATRLDALQVRCGSWAVAGTPGSFVVTRTLGALSPFRGGNGGTAFTYTCPDGGMLRGLAVRAGSRVDRVQPYCRTVGVTLR